MDQYKKNWSLVLLVSFAFAISACNSEQSGEITTGGDPDNGKALIKKYGCNACHVIGGIEGTSGQVGPPLTNIKARSYIAGVLSNTPANLQQWIMNPVEFSPKTAMPDLGVTEQDAQDIAAFLYSQ